MTAGSWRAEARKLARADLVAAAFAAGAATTILQALALRSGRPDNVARGLADGWGALAVAATHGASLIGLTLAALAAGALVAGDLSGDRAVLAYAAGPRRWSVLARQWLVVTGAVLSSMLVIALCMVSAGLVARTTGVVVGTPNVGTLEAITLFARSAVVVTSFAAVAVAAAVVFSNEILVAAALPILAFACLLAAALLPAWVSPNDWVAAWMQFDNGGLPATQIWGVAPSDSRETGLVLLGVGTAACLTLALRRVTTVDLT